MDGKHRHGNRRSGEVKPLADKLMDKYPQIVSVVNNITSRKAGVAIGEREIPLSGLAFIKDKIGEFEFEISANSFFQTNTRGAERLYKTVKEYARLNREGDGCGSLQRHRSHRHISYPDAAKKVIGMEIVESAVTDAMKNCRLNGISNCRFILGDIKEGLKKLANSPDVMIIDPPRAGMHKDVVRRIIDMAPERIVYVSCNPSTMARDLGILKDRYAVQEIQPIDMFPHTYHIESVARLALKPST